MNRVDPRAVASVQLQKRSSPDLFVNRTDVQYLIGLGVAYPDRLIDIANDLEKDLLCILGRGIQTVLSLRGAKLMPVIFKLGSQPGEVALLTAQFTRGRLQLLQQPKAVRCLD